MHIAIVCYPSRGGSGVVASELALGLAERGHIAHIVSYSVPFRLREFNPRVRIHEVEVATYPLFKYPPYTLGLATKLAEVAAEQSLDIIHAHYAVPHAVSAFLAKAILGEGAPKIVTTLHGTDITLVGADESFHRVTKFAIEVSDAVTAVSQFLRQRTIDEFSLEREVDVHLQLHRYIARTKNHGLWARALGSRGRENPHPRVQLPSGETRERRRSCVRSRPARDPGEVALHR